MSFKFRFIFPAHYHAGFSNATHPKLISQTPLFLPPVKFLFSRIQFLRMTFSLSLRFKHFSFTPFIQVISDPLQGVDLPPKYLLNRIFHFQLHCQHPIQCSHLGCCNIIISFSISLKTMLTLYWGGNPTVLQC